MVKGRFRNYLKSFDLFTERNIKIDNKTYGKKRAIMKKETDYLLDCESDMDASFATCLSVSWITCDVNDDFKIIDNLSEL